MLCVFSNVGATTGAQHQNAPSRKESKDHTRIHLL